jgi:hypothetical protein
VPRIRAQDIKRRFSFTRFSGNITKLFVNDLSNLLVKGPEGYLCRTSLGAEITVDTSACHMSCSGQMKHWIFRREVSCSNQAVLFQGANIAKTDWTHVAAAVALYASVKLA